jgi:anthranilate phosphoribosyltransferase
VSLARAIALAVERREVASDVLEAAFGEIASGRATPVQIAALLVALRTKGETASEIAAVARVLRQHAEPATLADSRTVDTCGTGGDGADTFNISTIAAFVVAGAGVPVAKHGNRSISSRSGSADVLAALGVNIECAPETVARCIEQCGLGFMFAPVHHPTSRHVTEVRRELGIRTIFNLLGPLTNPAGTKYQVVGVFAEEWVEPIARVLGLLGVERAWVVHGADGLDELTTTGISHVAVLDRGRVSTFRISPRNAGLPDAKPDDLTGGDATENAAHIRAVLQGNRGPLRDIVLLNAAAALLVAGKSNSLREGVALAAESIDSGKAKAVLDALVELSHAKV